MSSQKRKNQTKESVNRGLTQKDRLDRRTLIKGSIGVVGASLLGCDDENLSVPENQGDRGGNRPVDDGDHIGGVGGTGGSNGEDMRELGGFMGGESGGNIGGEFGGNIGDEHGGEQSEHMDEEPLYIDRPQDPPRVSSFPYGVASGDPLHDRVILWTKLELEEREQEVSVEWEVWLDEAQTQSVRSGQLMTSIDSNYTVKIDVDQLEADQIYYYQFKLTSQGTSSHLGRTRTLPLQSDQIRLAMTSCANYSVGYFHVYRHLSMQNNLHAVLHLGDYIYESGRYGFVHIRDLEADIEVRTLDQYRKRYAHYRSDLDLQALHRLHPMIAVWDDHEFANNVWSGGDGDVEEEAWFSRRDIAKQAYHEWLPTRPTPSDPLYRRFSFGNLVDLWMLETRIDGRSAPVEGAQGNIDRFNDDRMLISSTQEEWLLNGLQESQSPWKVVGQQVMMSQLLLKGALEAQKEMALPLNRDQWDGYVAQRKRILETVRDQEIQGVVVLSGDIHTSWSAELTLNPNDPLYYRPNSRDDSGVIAFECTTPSVTSPALASVHEGILNLIESSNPHIKWTQLTKHGFVLLDFTSTLVQARWFLIDSINQPQLPIARESALIQVSAADPHIDFTLVYDWNSI